MLPFTTHLPNKTKIYGKVIINSYEDFEKLVGQQIGVSEYVELTQERINLFADATLDHQWIHIDTERAKTESPFKSTIAHGYLTLSMLPHLWNQIIEVNNLKMMINYGMDKMKFGQAVLSGQSIRLVASLHSLANLRGVAKAEIKFAIEIQGEKKKALEGIAVFYIISTDYAQNGVPPMQGGGILCLERAGRAFARICVGQRRGRTERSGSFFRRV